MSVIVPAEGIILDQILKKTGAGHGLTPAAWRKFNNALSQTSWGQTHQHRMALIDGSDVLASAQRYDFMGMLDQCPVRICGVGTVFCDQALRDRSHARVLVEQLVHEAGRNGADLVLVFCPPDSGSHAPDGFDVMPAMEVELTVKEPSRYGAPMMLVRDGDDRDLAAVVAMGRVQAGQFRFHVDRDLDLVKYAIMRASCKNR